jgi:5-methylcytosine-specific restriction endonuclease McrA
MAKMDVYRPPLDEVPETLSWFQVRNGLFNAAFLREGGHCYWCNRPVRRQARAKPWHPLSGDHPTLDHLVPRSKGGRDTIENVVLACNACNHERGNMSAKGFAKRLKRQNRLRCPLTSGRMRNETLT